MAFAGINVESFEKIRGERMFENKLNYSTAYFKKLPSKKGINEFSSIKFLQVFDLFADTDVF